MKRIFRRGRQEKKKDEIEIVLRKSGLFRPKFHFLLVLCISIKIWPRLLSVITLHQHITRSQLTAVRFRLVPRKMERIKKVDGMSCCCFLRHFFFSFFHFFHFFHLINNRRSCALQMNRTNEGLMHDNTKNEHENTRRIRCFELMILVCVCCFFMTINFISDSIRRIQCVYTQMRRTPFFRTSSSK